MTVLRALLLVRPARRLPDDEWRHLRYAVPVRDDHRCQLLRRHRVRRPGCHIGVKEDRLYILGYLGRSNPLLAFRSYGLLGARSIGHLAANPKDRSRTNIASLLTPK